MVSGNDGSAMMSPHVEHMERTTRSSSNIPDHQDKCTDSTSLKFGFTDKEDTNKYDAYDGNNPGGPGIGSLNPILDGRSSGSGPGSEACRSAESHPGSRAICARPFCSG